MFGPNFILMLLMFGGEGGVINTMLTLMIIKQANKDKWSNLNI